jgi:uncharacterized membrane protein YfcA
VRALLASPLALLIGVSLGALGGGGSILAVPALVYAAGQTPEHATTTSLVLVAVTAVIAIIPHWHAGRVRLGAGILFGLVGIGGSVVGSRWNEAANPDLLLLAFAGLMFVAATAMWRRTRRPAPRAAARCVSAAAASASVALARPIEVCRVVRVAVAGTVVSLVGVSIGTRLAGTRDSASLQRWFVVLLVAVATYTAVRSSLALL